MCAVEIADQMFGCKYGTFLGDNERDRRDPLRPVVGKTTSLWTDLLSPPHFEQYVSSEKSLLLHPLHYRLLGYCLHCMLKHHFLVDTIRTKRRPGARSSSAASRDMVLAESTPLNLNSFLVD